jgi:hypothetical protein
MVSAKLSKEMCGTFTIEIEWEKISETTLKFVDLQKSIFVNVKSFNLFPDATPSVCILLDES